MKRLFAALAVLVSTLVCRESPYVLSLSAEQKKLVVYTSADNPPYEFMKHGEIVGFDIDLAREIANGLGMTLKVSDMPFQNIVPSLISNRCDMAVAAITPTAERRESVDFSIPYQKSNSGVVLVDDGSFSNMAGSNAELPIDILAGKTVGVQLGTHHETDVRAANIPGLTLKRYENIGTMIAEINKSITKRGEIYALVLGYPEATEIASRNHQLCAYPLSFSDVCAVALPKNSPYREKINEIIERLRKEDKLRELEMKWGISK